MIEQLIYAYKFNRWEMCGQVKVVVKIETEEEMLVLQVLEFWWFLYQSFWHLYCIDLHRAPFNLHSVTVDPLFVLVMTQYWSNLTVPALTSILLLVHTNWYEARSISTVVGITLFFVKSYYGSCVKMKLTVNKDSSLPVLSR